mgnify:CR=1 FL=1
MTYAVMRLNKYTHIEDTYTCMFNSDDRFKCIAYIKAKDELARIQKTDDKYFIFTRLDVVPEGESIDTYVSNEDVYKNIKNEAI